MSYIKYLTHKTSKNCLNKILNEGFKSKLVHKEADMLQCVWFNYIGIYKDNTFFSNMPTTVSEIDIMLCIDFNKLLLELKNMDREVNFEKFRGDIGIFENSLRYDYDHDDIDNIYELALNNIDEESSLMEGLMKLDNKDSAKRFEKMRDNWNNIVEKGNEIVFFQNSRFKLNIKEYLSSVIIFDHDIEGEIREILDINNLNNVNIHKNWNLYYREEIDKINLQRMCRNIKHYYNKYELEKIVKKYKITLGGRTKSEICMNLYLQLLISVR